MARQEKRAPLNRGAASPPRDAEWLGRCFRYDIDVSFRIAQNASVRYQSVCVGNQSQSLSAVASKISEDERSRVFASNRRKCVDRFNPDGAAVTEELELPR